MAPEASVRLVAFSVPMTGTPPTGNSVRSPGRRIEPEAAFTSPNEPVPVSTPPDRLLMVKPVLACEPTRASVPLLLKVPTPWYSGSALPGLKRIEPFTMPALLTVASPPLMKPLEESPPWELSA